MRKGFKAKLEEMAAGGPPTEFKLTASPGYNITSDDPNSVFVSLSLWNNSTPPAELHNIDGEYRTDQRFVLATATRPTKYFRSKRGPIFAYYRFSLAMLHKNVSIQIAQWKFRTPIEGEFIPFGIDVISSETAQQRIDWRVVRDGERVRIIDAR
jgi:hypothetical protein